MGLLNEFKNFAMRGNLVDLAVGFTVGAAFSTIAKSAVNDIVMPPVGLLMGNADFADLFLVLQEGSKAPAPYETLSAAQAAGAVTLNYGIFINHVIAFLLVALVMFFLIRGINRLEARLENEFGHEEGEPEQPTHKKCRFCRSTIAYKATRCPCCTSQLAPGSAPVQASA